MKNMDISAEPVHHNQLISNGSVLQGRQSLKCPPSLCRDGDTFFVLKDLGRRSFAHPSFSSKRLNQVTTELISGNIKNKKHA